MYGQRMTMKRMFQFYLICALLLTFSLVFARPPRDEWQKVDQVIKALDLKQGHSIADIGGKDGYFSIPFAKALGPTGVVYCCDIDAEPMKKLQDKAKAAGLENIVTVLAAEDRPMLPPGSLDIVFFCNTNHHLADRVSYYKGLVSLLRPGGILVVIDWNMKERPVGPPPGHAMLKKVVIDEMKQAGWVLKNEETLLPYQYFLIFQPLK